MLLNTTLIKKSVFYAEENWNSENKSILTINTNWIDGIKRVFSFQLNINCRKQIRFNLGDWWIILLHNIGSPPTTNNYHILPVSGNFLI
jgi:hypothetical protein